MAAKSNAEELRQYKVRFSWTVRRILSFASGTNLVREVKQCIAKLQTNCVTMFSVIEYSHSEMYIPFIAKI